MCNIVYKFEKSETNPSFQFRCLNSRLKLERSPLSWQIFIRTVEKNGPSCFFFFFFSLTIDRYASATRSITFPAPLISDSVATGERKISVISFRNMLRAPSHRGHLLKQAVKSIITFLTYSKRGSDTCYFNDWNRVKWKLTRGYIRVKFR